jgi:hypothetical protein
LYNANDHPLVLCGGGERTTTTDDEKLLFRMDSKATKKVISFMTAVGLEYLEKALGPIIRKMCEGTLTSAEGSHARARPNS